MARTTIDIPDDLWRDVRVRAAKEGTTATKIAILALQSWMAPPKAAVRTEAKTETTVAVGKTVAVPSSDPNRPRADAFAQFRPVPKPGKK